MSQVPVIDCTPLFGSDTSSSFSPSPEYLATVSQIDTAFRTWGIFILTGTTSIPPSLTNDLRAALNKFFSLPDQKKQALHLKKGGWAWRGYMPWGGEGTKGSTDQKEGFYGGPELGDDDDEHPLKGMPTYGENQFPDEDVPEMRKTVLEYIEKVTEVGLVVSDAMSVGLGLEKGQVRRLVLEPEPVQLFRVFKYSKREGVETYGIGKHSDFGFLTILRTFDPDSFVVNVGDILDRLTNGLYTSPLHRVLPPSPTSRRLSIPFFFDPAWTAHMKAFPGTASNGAVTDPAIIERWDQRTTFSDLKGIWGQYLGVKVKKIFPDLVLPEFSAVTRASGRHLVEVRKASA
ncbi:hypothetical protein M413DRAFT_27556 [Hebeloma cylindrosporum]|uniref:Fe2OG dioxygenase domain-containing protein n=1 Tax=Hebeloma cylindrosporum TaxID=76867 RepID=A0A0C3CCQ8_HEBCY|nr:hypothetical protein M413DRAFT_27556 [Hebeloma cylindrosporum h7]